MARRRGTEAHVEERRLAARIDVEIWRRGARMVRQCLPATADAEAECDLPALAPEVLWRVGPPGTVEQDVAPMVSANGGQADTAAVPSMDVDS